MAKSRVERCGDIDSDLPKILVENLKFDQLKEILRERNMSMSSFNKAQLVCEAVNYASEKFNIRVDLNQCNDLFH